jgi:hypothetical protein
MFHNGSFGKFGELRQVFVSRLLQSLCQGLASITSNASANSPGAKGLVFAPAAPLARHLLIAGMHCSADC